MNFARAGGHGSDLGKRVMREKLLPILLLPMMVGCGGYRVDSVKAGDLLVLAGKGEVRLAGIQADDPANDTHGKEAKQFAEKFLRGRARLEYIDVPYSEQDKDACVYGRRGCLNEVLLKAGLVRALDTKHARRDRYLAVEQEAFTAQRGRW